MIIIILVGLSIAIVSFIVSRYIGLLNITNPIVPLYYYHTVFFLIGIMYAGRYEHVYITNELIAYTLYGYLMLFLSAITFCKLFRIKHGRFIAIKLKNSLPLPASYIYAAFLLQSVVIVIILFFFYSKGVLILADDADNYRVVARKGFGFSILLFRWMSEIFIVVGSLYFISRWTKKRFLKLLFLIYFMFTLLLMIGLGSRSFVLELVLIYVAIYYWLNIKKFDFKLFLMVASFFLFMGAVALFRQGYDINLTLLWDKILWRPFANIQNFQWVLDDFANNERLYGKSLLIELNTLLPGYQPNFGTWYKDNFGYVFSGGSVTVTYLGEIYANFGFIGVLVYPMLLGIGVAIIIFMIQRKSGYPAILISIVSSLSLKGIVNVGLGATLVGTIFPVIFVFSIFIFFRMFLDSVLSSTSIYEKNTT